MIGCAEYIAVFLFCRRKKRKKRKLDQKRRK